MSRTTWHIIIRSQLFTTWPVICHWKYPVLHPMLPLKRPWLTAKRLLYKSNPLGNSTCSHNDPRHRLLAGDGSGRVGILRHLQMKMQRTKWLSTKMEHRLRQYVSGKISAEAIIISFAFKLCFPLRRKCEHFQIPFIKQRYFCFSHLLCLLEKDRKWLRGHGGHLNCFILKQTRHVIKIPQDALIKLAKLIQIIFTHLSD